MKQMSEFINRTGSNINRRRLVVNEIISKDANGDIKEFEADVFRSNEEAATVAGTPLEAGNLKAILNSACSIENLIKQIFIPDNLVFNWVQETDPASPKTSTCRIEIKYLTQPFFADVSGYDPNFITVTPVDTSEAQFIKFNIEGTSYLYTNTTTGTTRTFGFTVDIFSDSLSKNHIIRFNGIVNYTSVSRDPIE
jgi:hypothetical protein